MKLSVIIPAYNEEFTLVAVIQKVQSVLLPPGMTKEIVIVDDGSIDRTAKILETYTSDPSIKIFHNPLNLGKTAAIKLGIEHSSGDLILIQDADLEYNPNEYAKLLTPIIQQKASVVYGSRFKGKIQEMTLINRFANMFSNLTFYLLFLTPLTDTRFLSIPNKIVTRMINPI
jgi:glycosyltransferase involved in cell wall biosynthesis